jgi:hypothetical protein
MRRLLVCCLLVWSIADLAGADRGSAAALRSQLNAGTSGMLLVNGYTRNFVYAVSAYAAPATGRFGNSVRQPGSHILCGARRRPRAGRI